jgi:nitrogen fixation-related uncharacterized protein
VAVFVPSFAEHYPNYHDDELNRRLTLALASSQTRSGPSTSISAFFWALKGNYNDADGLNHRLAMAKANAHVNAGPGINYFAHKKPSAESPAVEDMKLPEHDGASAVNQPTEHQDPTGLIPGA